MYVDYSVFYGGMRDLEHISWEPLQRHTINNILRIQNHQYSAEIEPRRLMEEGKSVVIERMRQNISQYKTVMSDVNYLSNGSENLDIHYFIYFVHVIAFQYIINYIMQYPFTIIWEIKTKYVESLCITAEDNPREHA